MDHSHHDSQVLGHSDMGHSHTAMDMGGHGHGNMCSMNMLFTWDTKNLCVVFRSWRVTNSWSLIWTLVAVAALTAGYEAVREASRRYELRHAARMEQLVRIGSARAQERQGRIVKALFYGVQVFYSFFIMLLFMTYNGWIMIAVGVGAFLGYLMFSGATASKTAACH